MRSLIYALVCLCAVTSMAATPERVVSVHVAGELQGSVMTVRTVLGDGVTRALRVYSEPSGTLLAAYVNSDAAAPISESAVADALEAVSRSGRRVPVARFPFKKDGEALVQSEAPPSTDNAIRLVIDGSWIGEDGIVRERELSAVIHTNALHFAFTYSRVQEMVAEDDPTEPRGVGSRSRRFRIIALDQLCCGESGSGSCNYSCASCSPGKPLSCCYTTADNCPWCGKLVAGCNQLCSDC